MTNRNTTVEQKADDDDETHGIYINRSSDNKKLFPVFFCFITHDKKAWPSSCAIAHEQSIKTHLGTHCFFLSFSPLTQNSHSRFHKKTSQIAVIVTRPARAPSHATPI